VGHLLLDQPKNDWGNVYGPSRPIPVFKVRLELLPDEWGRVHECLSVAGWTTGRVPMLTVRGTFPEAVDWAELLRQPWYRSYPVTRYWLEAVAAYTPSLDKHPLFRGVTETGGIEEIF
jgi:hypothetical protein